MAARDITVHRHHLSAGRHLYPGLIVARLLHNFEDFVSGYQELSPLPSLPPEFFVLFQVALLILLAAATPSVAHGRPWALRLAKLWAIIEILNGVGHIMITLLEWEFYPGFWTSPLLVIFGAALGRSLRR
ncbi:MAG: HXXEE domain-containing protein [Gemmatimonadetes bacterium]|uniref:HXXEE domain-containing protein n=1 Tax=Candidatus Kutchimonas denitrificans TaxID=3056748 RepID=A0AAE4Z8I4_9BACT|nr:HXXEE domain-containing protein [Gemmatimonadota bacterium]NIR74953.1 HXXEE domain-containing protein [Candidatus Kutchimonas denitrificans]NIS00065.1 HXXEE domain-containing protein [Gemmatimonadota bacterium]NIT65648.1 HXXEE domain-containing protein [Gemmatimonadota bacterium]NIU52618.1 HXXEE domain-containing protein [Gemmatimonadota bacterium]